MSAARSVLLVVDLQERLLPVIAEKTIVADSVMFLMDVAQLLNVPVIVSEQYPRGLGPTVAPLSAHPAVTARFEKLKFSAAEGLAANLPPASAGRDQIVICGIETHVCVLQTALDLQAERQVFVIADAVGSRRRSDHATALQRLRDSGCTVATAESAAFEWCEAAGTDVFRAISRLVRDRSQREAERLPSGPP